MGPVDGLNLNVYPAYLPEILYSGQEWPGVPNYQHLLAPGYEAGAHRVPDADNAAVVALGRFEQRVTIPIGSYVWGFAGKSSQAAGFNVQIIDTGTGAAFWSGGRAWHVLTNGQGQTIDSKTYPLVPIEQPRMVIEPGILKVQIENLSTSANSIQFVIWTAEPIGSVPV